MKSKIYIIFSLIMLFYINKAASNNKHSRRSRDREPSKKALNAKGDPGILRDRNEVNEYDSCSVGGTGPPGPQGIQGIQGVQGVQGPVGVHGPQGPPGRMGRKGEPGSAGRRGRKGDPAVLTQETLHDQIPTAAFSVTMDFDMMPSNDYHTVAFNIKLYDPADLYSVTDKTFTVPINGTYVIGFQGVSYHGYNVLLHLVKNDERMLSAFGNSGCAGSKDVDVKELECAGSAGNVGIFRLAKGDKMWIELPDPYGLHNAAFHNYATFYGYRLAL